MQITEHDLDSARTQALSTLVGANPEHLAVRPSQTPEFTPGMDGEQLSEQLGKLSGVAFYGDAYSGTNLQRHQAALPTNPDEMLAHIASIYMLDRLNELAACRTFIAPSQWRILATERPRRDMRHAFTADWVTLMIQFARSSDPNLAGLGLELLGIFTHARKGAAAKAVETIVETIVD